MAYPIKNTAVVETNSIKTGNFALGVNQGGYGPTSSTAFWNGRPPNVGGYVVYSGNGVNSPRMYTVANDAELITLSNQLGGSGITTIYGALNYFNLSSTLTCVNIEPPNIVTNGLVLYLDAGFTPSYPESGTTWTNLSSSANTGTLINGPVYSSDAGGSISFDGTNDYMSVPSLSGTSFPQSTGTISFWYYIDPTGSGERAIFDSPGSGRNRFSVYVSNSNTLFISAWFSTGFNSFNYSYFGYVGSWNHIVITYTSLNSALPYLNGQPSILGNLAGFSPSGQFVGFGSPTTAAAKGKSFNLMIYWILLMMTDFVKIYLFLHIL
jgi:hypothetical protein